MVRLTLFLILLLAALAGFSQKDKQKLKYNNGGELIKAMHTAYAPDKWYRYLTFSQTMEFYRNDSIVQQEVWHEAYQPGCLLIKYRSKDSKEGRLYKNFTQYAFKPGEAMRTAARVHELVLVGFDVYFFNPETTIRVLDSLGFDLSKIREDELNGRKVFVVGADKGDETSRQFWIDARRLYLHRIVYGQSGKMNDVAFDDYEKQQNNWIAKTIRFKTNGKLRLVERYFDIRFPKTLPEAWFDQEKFNTTVLD